MLTDPRHPRVRAARRLSRRAAREQTRTLVAEGPQAVREAAAARGPDGASLVVEAFCTPGGAERFPQIVAALGAVAPLHECSDAVLESIAQTVRPQGLVALCRSPLVGLDDVLAGPPRLVAVLARVRDPGNAGTVLRCADAAGADGVVITDESVDVTGGKAVRASAGSLFHLPVHAGSSLVATVEAARAAGLTVLAADGDGTVDLDDAADTGLLARPTAWVFGNEAWGLHAQDRDLADHVVRVPLHGRAESLNLATAAAVCLYASARAQRRADPATPGNPVHRHP